MEIPNVICEYGGSDDDFISTSTIISIKPPEYDFKSLKRKIGKAIKRILSQVGAIPPDMWPDIPSPLCIARHLEENLQYGDTYKPSVVTRADFLLGVIKFQVAPFVGPSVKIEYPSLYAVPMIQCVVSPRKPDELNISMGLGSLWTWDWATKRDNSYERPPFD